MAKQSIDSGTQAFEEWVKKFVHCHVEEIPNIGNMDTFLLFKKLLQKAIHYKRMRTFGNHFRVKDGATSPSH